MAKSSLAHKNILITGAARRLGRAMVIACADQGATILLHYRESSEEAELLAKKLDAKGVTARLFQADLTQPRSCESLFADCLNAAGSVDAIINNASIFPSDTVWDITEDSILENLRLHTLAPYRLAKSMHEADQKGCIINMLDTRMDDYDSQHVSYHLSKRMLFDMTRILSLEMAPNIRVNAIAPGLILPPEGHDTSYLEKLAHTNPLKTFGEPEDIGHAALFLLESPFITGQTIYVDGGRHTKGKFYG
ncbi:MAG: short-chain dehydrogenase [Candidatus Hydrogenedentota bacterium]|nr:MAG: short-chain dehydrogenase [Candidatus Hydrogenedentota bacterium]